MTTPSPADLATAKRISDYLVLGMHHSTREAQEAMARIIDEACQQRVDHIVEDLNRQLVQGSDMEAAAHEPIKLGPLGTHSATVVLP